MSARQLLAPCLRSIPAKGFTVIELLTVIAIVAIIATFAAPAMSRFASNANVRGAGQELRSAFIRGRSEAISRNTEVRLVPADADWRNGWVMETVAGDVIETRSQSLGSILTSPSPAQTVTYRVDGRVRSGSQTIIVRDERSESVPARCITLRANGVASTSVDTDGDASNGCK